ncbi:MAG: 3-deoxy-D-manno-octulosonic acid kinase [Gammaproteobacteria bacterium]|nr:MAG: 3-deoxy-D-manno-octulosonic acid kinase [Gammaproteobacteria bacterium]
MSSRADPQILAYDGGYILYDASLIAKPSNDLFNPTWLSQHGSIRRAGNGRGEAWFVTHDQQHWVLRHYLRGGMVARFNRDHYLGWRLKTTRAWKEWHLLQHMHDIGLPVPRPVAASVHWPFTRSSGLYQAWLLVEQIPDSSTLASHLIDSHLDDNIWQTIGQCLRRFHEHNIYHADLNANNILLDKNRKIYLIDFDRGAIKKHGPWKQQNLARLLRSLHKLQYKHEAFHFTQHNWHSLMQAYQANS